MNPTTTTSVSEQPEFYAAAGFWAKKISSHLRTLPYTQIQNFQEILLEGIKKRIEGHWYTDNPSKGQGYRALTCAESIDGLLLEAMRGAQLPNIDFRKMFPSEIVMYIDPGNVSIKYFTPNSRHSSVHTIYPVSENGETENADFRRNSLSSSPPKDLNLSENPGSRRNSLSPTMETQLLNGVANVRRNSVVSESGNNNISNSPPKSQSDLANSANLQRRGSLSPKSEVPLSARRNSITSNALFDEQHASGRSIWAKSSTEFSGGNNYVTARRNSLNPNAEMQFMNAGSNALKSSGEFSGNYQFQRRNSFQADLQYANKENMMRTSAEFVPASMRKNSLSSSGGFQNFSNNNMLNNNYYASNMNMGMNFPNMEMMGGNNDHADMAQAYMENRKMYEQMKFQQYMKSAAYAQMMYETVQNENALKNSGEFLGNFRRNSFGYPTDAY